jgi:diguanylate cyclase (GGDEF)-like protein
MAMTLVLTPGQRRAPSGLLVGCLGATLVLDTLFALPGLDAMMNLARLDAALLVVNSLLAAAALHPAADELAAPPASSGGVAHLHRWRVVLLGAALVAVTLVGLLPTGAMALADRTVLVVAGVVVSLTIIARFHGVVREREAAEAQLVHQAHHDQLTGLANRSLLLDRLGLELAPGAAGPAHHLVLLYVDLDGFKSVNDRFGHAGGDHVLRTVGERLLAVTRRGDTVARLGGDEFVALCRDVPPESAEGLGAKLRDAVTRPVELPTGDRVSVGASVGVFALSPNERALPAAGTLEEVLRAADAAMYEAKHDGGGVRVRVS